MFEDNQRIGGESLAKQESLDYGIISINDPKSRFTAHISGDVPPEIAKGNIAWSRVSVREHPNGKNILFQKNFNLIYIQKLKEQKTNLVKVIN